MKGSSAKRGIMMLKEVNDDEFTSMYLSANRGVKKKKRVKSFGGSKALRKFSENTKKIIAMQRTNHMMNEYNTIQVDDEATHNADLR